MDDASREVLDLAQQLKVRSSQLVNSEQLVSALTEQNKSLELDKADLFQRLYDLNQTLSSELNEQHRLDVLRRESEWDTSITLAIEHTTRQLHLKHEEERDCITETLMSQQNAAVFSLRSEFDDKETKFSEKIAEYTESLRKTRSLLGDAHEAIEKIKVQNQLDLVDRDKNHADVIATIQQVHLADLAIAEVQLQKSHDAHSQLLLIQHEEQCEQLRRCFQKKIEDLNVIHVTSTNSAIKEAEAIKDRELAQLKDEHLILMEREATRHRNELSTIILDMHMEKRKAAQAVEVKRLADNQRHNEEISGLNAVISTIKV